MKQSKLLAFGFCATLGFAGLAAAIPSASWADSTTCPNYPLVTTCNTPPTYGSTGGSTPPTAGVTEPSGVAFTNSTGALPFTGADIEQMAVVGGSALMVGSVLVARKRRRARA